MARSGAPSKRRSRNMPDHLHSFDGAELVDGTTLERVFWDRRLQGILMLDGSGRFYPASQVRFCWWDSTIESSEVSVVDVRESD